VWENLKAKVGEFHQGVYNSGKPGKLRDFLIWKTLGKLGDF